MNDKLNDKNAWGFKMKSWSRVLVTGLAVGAVAVGGVFAASANEPTAADVQQPLVEDFGYPGAARILAEDNVELISGDGHIVYSPCVQQPENGIGVMVIGSTDLSVGGNNDGRVCFKVLGTPGLLVLRIPDAFEIRGDGHGSVQGHKGTVEVSRETGERRTVELNPNGNQQVGLGSNQPAETIVKLEIKP
ncbi:hypothetical protein [Lentzea californiensis]|uniref:hypothetical protein n=1 Tax=Lentzea californiensis TaxID=438851 RepID=UPI0021654980|nr:hypothetical protein [Lentzea californiensis]